LILAALALYFLDIVTRKLPAAQQWLGWLGVRPTRRAHVAARRESDGAPDGVRVAAARADGPGPGNDTPAGELYVARLRGRPPQSGSGWTVRR
jgi:hypothetical protein